MNKYDKNSLKAEEFINDGEILDSLKFADENKITCFSRLCKLIKGYSTAG